MDKLLQNPGFRFHLAAYVLVNAILAIVNYMHPDHIWFFWPLLGWGIGLVAHGYAVTKEAAKPTPLQRRR
jgi:2TM domain-containing protein